jgi:hypothetical protein
MKNIKFFSIIFLSILLISLVSAGWFSNTYKVYSEEKVVKTVSKEKTINNFEKGVKWEAKTKETICGASGGCIYTAVAAQKRLRWSNYQEEYFIIYGGKATNQFINKNKLYKSGSFERYTKEPDFLTVKQVNGRITEITVSDAKLSEAAARKEQELAYLDFCERSIRSGVPCYVEYVVPKSSLSKSDAAFMCLATTPLAVTNPLSAGLEALCFLAVS